MVPEEMAVVFPKTPVMFVGIGVFWEMAVEFRQIARSPTQHSGNSWEDNRRSREHNGRSRNTTAVPGNTTAFRTTWHCSTQRRHLKIITSTQHKKSRFIHLPPSLEGS